MSRLVGQALLDFVRQKGAEGVDRDTVVEMAGYVARRGDKKSLQRTRFFEAIAQANGLALGPIVAPTTRSGFGAQPTYRVKVGKNGLLPVSAAYTRQIGLTPGSYGEIQIDEDAIVIFLAKDQKASAESEASAESQPAPSSLLVSQHDPMSAMVAA